MTKPEQDQQAIGDTYWEQFTPTRRSWSKKQRLIQAGLSLLMVAIIILGYEYYISRPVPRETVLTPMLNPIDIGSITLPTWPVSGIELPLKHTTPFTMVMLWQPDCQRCLSAAKDFQRTMAGLEQGKDVSLTVIMRGNGEEIPEPPKLQNVRLLLDAESTKVPYRVQQYPGSWLLNNHGKMIAYRDDTYRLGYWHYPAVQNALAEWLSVGNIAEPAM